MARISALCEIGASRLYRPYQLSILFVTTLLFQACSGPQVLLSQKDATIDSLYAVNASLREVVYAMQDSIRFLDDIDSGYYFREKRSLLTQIDKLEYDLGVCNDGGRTVAILDADELFESAEAVLLPDGEQRLTVLAEQLKREYAGRTIRVEGHSDSVPLGSRLREKYPSNWELSAARAAAVVRYLIDFHEMPTGQIEVVAFGSTKPVARNDTSEGRRMNRRIRIAVMP